MAALKGFKVTDVSRTKTCGIAVKCLEQLISKAKVKFNISTTGNVKIFLSDGTLVDNNEYFGTLPQHTLLVVAKSEERIVTGADLIYRALQLTNIDVLKAGENVESFLREDIKEKVRVLSDAVKNIEERKNEADFKSWLGDAETSYRTKETYMESRCRDRMKSYFYKAASDLKNSTSYEKHHVELDILLNGLKQLLNRHNYQGFYFNRRKVRESLCNAMGVFKCDGLWSKSKCLHQGGEGHRINPYFSYEQRIVFSTWNLDHRIERSRTIVPAILEAAGKTSSKKSHINVDYIYDLLFTRSNLRLVHVVCHDKGAHGTALVDPRKMLRSTPSVNQEIVTSRSP